MLAFHKHLEKLGMVILILSIASCKSTKSIGSGAVDTALSPKKIIQNHYQNQQDFQTLRGKVKIDYSDGENSQGVSVSMRIKKDEVIWISAPLGILKAHITPNKVSFYNKLEGEYFEGDFSYLSGILGTEVDFIKLQNLLIGNALLDLRTEKYVAINEGDAYGLKPKKQNDLYKILFFLEPKYFKITRQELSQPWKNRFLKMQYSYQEVDSKVIPNTIAIEAVSDEQVNTIALDYKSMEFDKQLNFPYRIPKGLKEIVLK